MKKVIVLLMFIGLTGGYCQEIVKENQVDRDFYIVAGDSIQDDDIFPGGHDL